MDRITHSLALDRCNMIRAQAAIIDVIREHYFDSGSPLTEDDSIALDGIFSAIIDVLRCSIDDIGYFVEHALSAGVEEVGRRD